MKPAITFLVLMLVVSSCNPFAPGVDFSADDLESILGDTKTVDGVFQNLKYAYTFRDTSIYGQLIDAELTFIYRDYDRGVDVSWGRDEEMRATNGLFMNVQRLDLVWNNIISISSDSGNTLVNVSRNFNLTVTFNPSSIERADGYANLVMSRKTADRPWQIVRWRDESNF